MSLIRKLSLGPQVWRLAQIQYAIHISKTSSVVVKTNCSLLHTTPSYTKSKKEKAGKSRKGNADINLSLDDIGEVVDMEQVGKEMADVVEQLQQQYIQQLSLRTSAGVFQNIIVKTDDGDFPLNQLGQISQKSGKLTAVNMAASPQYVPNVMKTIMESGLNINPQQEGTTIFLPIPVVTKEHREKLAKSAKEMYNKANDKLRDVYSRHTKKIKKATGISDNTVRGADQLILKTMHEHRDSAEQMMKTKQNDLLSGK